MYTIWEVLEMTTYLVPVCFILYKILTGGDVA